jgi:hypothetical protein
MIVEWAVGKLPVLGSYLTDIVSKYKRSTKLVLLLLPGNTGLVAWATV